jgi:hypothetical protein
MPAFSMIAANRPLNPNLPLNLFPGERRKHWRFADAWLFQQLALKPHTHVAMLGELPDSDSRISSVR